MIDLYSDTRTKPTPGMRRAIAEAEVGDEQAMLDPTVNLLCERVADLLGKEAAVYPPSGTMCNQIAARVHCRQGDEIILAASAHPFHAESGRTGGARRRHDAPPRGARHVRCRAGARRDQLAGLSPCAALAPARGREHHELRRRRRLADWAGPRGHRRRGSTGSRATWTGRAS